MNMVMVFLFLIYFLLVLPCDYATAHTFEFSGSLTAEDSQYFQKQTAENDSGLTRQITESYNKAYNSGRYADALFHAKELIQYAAQTKDTFQVYRNRIRIADVYRATRDFKASIKELNEILTQIKPFNNSDLNVYAYSLLGSVYYEIKNYDLSLRNLDLASAHLKQFTDTARIGYIYLIKGAVYRNLEKYAEAVSAFERAYEAYLKTSPEDIPNILTNISYNYASMKRFDEAVIYAENSLSIARSYGTKAYIAESMAALVNAYKLKGDYRSAFDHYNLYQTYMIDSLTKSQNEDLMNEVRTKYETEKKEIENIALKAQVENQRLTTISSIVILTMLVIVVTVLIILNRQKSKTEKLLLDQKIRIEAANAELLKLNAEIKENERRLENLNTVKDRWFTIVTHDIRSPISTLITTLDSVNMLEPEELKSMLTDIQQQVQTTFQLIENLLQWAYSQMSGIQVEAERFNIRDIIGNNINLLSYAAANKQVTINSHVKENIEVFADINMIDLVLRNLVSNAIKFSNKGGSISIDAAVNREFCDLTISDTGVGMTQEEVSQLFHSEKTESRPGTQNERGVGLGLILCDSFIRSNNGKISVTSEKGKGTQFHVSIPLTPSIRLEK